jgi:NADPH-dependent 2,4-dienoyl-CoA reductase/sulfur reductase-like enzyme
LATFLNEYYTAQGVKVLAEQKVIALARHGEQSFLHLDPGMPLHVDVVVAGLGIEPNVTLAEQAGLNLDNGIEVDQHLQTSQTDIYAAGDVASFYCSALEKRLRVEHADNADAMGRCAGRNMAGAEEPYTHLPGFYSDLFDLGYEAVGETDSSLDIVTTWKEPNLKGIVYYLRGGHVRGVLLWNVRDQIHAATRLIEEDASPVSNNSRGAFTV